MNGKRLIIIIANNERENVELNLAMLRQFLNFENEQIVIVDNHSEDGLDAWLLKQEDLSVLCCEEEDDDNYGGLLNIVHNEWGDNRDLVILRANYAITPNSLELLEEALYEDTQVGAAGPYSNGFYKYQHIREMNTYEEAVEIATRRKQELNKNVLELESNIIYIKGEVIKKVGEFNESIIHPEDVIREYLDRIVLAGYQLVECGKSVFFAFNKTNNIMYDKSILQKARYSQIDASEEENDEYSAEKLKNLLFSFGDVQYKGIHLYKYIEPDFLVGLNLHNHISKLERNAGIKMWKSDNLEVPSDEAIQSVKNILYTLEKRKVLFMLTPARRLYKNEYSHIVMEPFIESIEEDLYTVLEYGREGQYNGIEKLIKTKNRQVIDMAGVVGLYGSADVNKEEIADIIVNSFVKPVEKLCHILFDEEILMYCFLEARYMIKQRQAYMSFYEKILVNVSPSVVIYSHANDMLLTYLRDAAMAMKIPTLEISHGVGQRGVKVPKHLTYSDYTITFSEIEVEICKKMGNDTMIAIGKPGIYQDIHPVKTEKTIISFISSLEFEIFEYAQFISKRVNKEKFRVIYKPHNAEIWSLDEIKTIEMEYNNLTILYGRKDIRELLDISNIVVGMQSSGLYDAMLYQQTKIIVIKQKSKNYSFTTIDQIRNALVSKNEFILVENEEQLYYEILNYKQDMDYRSVPNSFWIVDAENRFKRLVNDFIKEIE